MNFILKRMEDFKKQALEDINAELGIGTYPDANKLASEMYTASHYFICQMCTFITEFIMEMKSTAESTTEEGWELMSSIIPKIFDELRRVRAPAATAVADKNPITKCAAYMWALIQAKRVQKEFLDARFRNHPTIAPVIILHVFRTRVTKVQFK
jgi:hypothetical protein